MCGIAGIVDPSGAARHREALERASAAMQHRGPDGAGSYVEGQVGLAHRRLSILDLAGGAQPMFGDDGKTCIVFNGEIYNYRELREPLARERPFRTSSDTEVLLRLYEARGKAMLREVRGMFAFAIWDARHERLFAARDRYGEKPFLYAYDGSTLRFASEMRALRTLGPVRAKIDASALDDYLSLLYVRAPRTILEGVRKLPAGHALTLDRDGLVVAPYDSVPVPGTRRAARDERASTRRLLEQAVRLQLRSDVPVGALLSGGLDSSTVVALVARELGQPVRNFSVGFGADDDELPFARVVATKYATDRTEIVVEDDLETRVERALAAYSEPFGDSSAVPSVAVFEAIAGRAKVVLTGDGGDELFAGYDRYRVAERWPMVPAMSIVARAIERAQAHVPSARTLSRARRAALLASSRPADRRRALVEVFGRGERARLTGRTIRVEADDDEVALGAADSAIHDDLRHYLPDDLMLKTDIAAMRSSIESRSPLLDPDLARSLVPLPASSKQNAHEGKLLLRAAVRDLLPPEILARRKRGFGSPVDAWLRGPLAGAFRDAMRSDFVRDHFDAQAVREIVRAIERGRGNGHQGWALFALARWADVHR